MAAAILFFVQILSCLPQESLRSCATISTPFDIGSNKMAKLWAHGKAYKEK